MKKILVSAITVLFSVLIFTLVLASCVKGNTFTVTNQSDYDLLNVTYDGNKFGDIKSGSKVTINHPHYNESYSRSIEFELKTIHDINKWETEEWFKINVRCRTEPITCEKAKNNVLTITNNTVVTITGDGVSNSLRNVYNSLNQ